MTMPPLPAQCCLYLRYEKDGKWNKVPCDVHGREINHLNPSNWMTLSDAWQHATWDEKQPDRPYGVAFVLTKDDPWFFFDFDHALDAATGQWKQAHVDIATQFPGAWFEVSTSGTGFHLLGYCQPHMLEDRRRRWDNDFECYTHDRFIAMNKYEWQRMGGVDVDYDHTQTLLNIVPQRAQLGELSGEVDPSYTGPEDDDELIGMMLRSTGKVGAAFGHGVTVRDLWERNEPALARQWPSETTEGGFDWSRADMALASHLAFWTGKNVERMDRLFRRSGLYRPKWDRKDGYGRHTLTEGARLTKRVYDAPRRDAGGDNPGSKANGKSDSMFLTEQPEYFDGCVYVVQPNKILTPKNGLLSSQQFNAVYGGYKFQLGLGDASMTCKKAWEAFTENRYHDFPMANSTRLVPGKPFGEIDNYGSVNVYQPPVRHGIEGDISIFHALLERAWPEPVDRAILLNYLASAAQNVGKMPKWAPVLQGVEGCGKGLIAEVFQYVIGIELTMTLKTDVLTEKHNGWLAENIGFFGDEIRLSRQGPETDIVKQMVTESRMPIRPMAGTAYTAEVCSWFLFCTNHKQSVPKSKNDRRFAVMYSAAQTEEDLERLGLTMEFFNEYIRQKEHERLYDKIVHFLENMPLDPRYAPAVGVHRAPKTSVHDEAVMLGQNQIEMEIIEAAEEGRVGFRGGFVSSYMLEQLLREKHIKCSRTMQQQILTSLGYTGKLRSQRVLVNEANRRPMIYYKEDGYEKTTDEYTTAQGYSFG